jgi:hypothetical protein
VLESLPAVCPNPVLSTGAVVLETLPAIPAGAVRGLIAIRTSRLATDPAANPVAFRRSVKTDLTHAVELAESEIEMVASAPDDLNTVAVFDILRQPDGSRSGERAQRLVQKRK